MYSGLEKMACCSRRTLHLVVQRKSKNHSRFQRHVDVPLYLVLKVRSYFDQVKDISQKLGMTPAQVYISWHIQRGVCLPLEPKIPFEDDNIIFFFRQLSCQKVLPHLALRRISKVISSFLFPARKVVYYQPFIVSRLPKEAFECLEKVATGHTPLRLVNPSWGVDIWN